MFFAFIFTRDRSGISG